MEVGLELLESIGEGEANTVYATDPHQLQHALESLNVLTVSQMIMNASLARKASSEFLNFYRSDYPELDPPEWHKFVTIKQENDEVKVGDLPIDYGSPLKENYEEHCV
jgi:succinate dehydrogenase/fumarate reductase flavoprotein subunit